MWMPALGFASIHSPSTIKTARVAIPFLANQSFLADKSILFYANTFAGTMMVHDNGEMIFYSQSTGQRFVERLSGTIHFEPQPGERSHSAIHLYFPNTLAAGKTQVEAFNHILMPDIYPNISMQLKAYGHTVEKVFIVNPGGHPDQIEVHVDIAQKLEITSDGQLIIFPQGIQYSSPKAFQITGNQKVDVTVRFCLKDKTTYGFIVDQYNSDMPLMIDPFIAGTFFGGDNVDEIEDVAVASNGDVYVAGTTQSANIPINAASSGYTQIFDPIMHKEDIFIARFNSDLSTLLSATFIGGSEPDIAKSIAIDPTGNVFVCGLSMSSDFPISEAATYKGDGDIVVVRMSPDLSTLLSATLLGGSKPDTPEDMVINSQSKEIYIAGYTQSDDFDSTRFQVFDGITDAFVVRLNNDLSILKSAQYIGGNNVDKAFAIQINSSQNVIVAGQTYSEDFPAMPGSYDITHNGSMDGFACEISKDLGIILFSTFLGGGNTDTVTAIVVDHNDSIYVSGTTSSYDFPILQTAYDNALNGTDIFVAKFDLHLEKLEASTFMGGTNWENATDMALNANNEIVISGITVSDDFPTTPGVYDQVYNGDVDTFIATFNPELTSLSASTFLGAASDDHINGIAMQNDNIVIAGTSWSNGFPISTPAFDSTFNEREGFISILSQDLSGPLRIVSESESIHITMSEDGNPMDFSLVLSAENDLSGEIFGKFRRRPIMGMLWHQGQVLKNQFLIYPGQTGMAQTALLFK
ncbi:MAG: cell surface glycoprotein (s-layer protein) related protein [Candidatus Magnetoglobus multicellularis str. Araruama]|uniref:Cell surface glycoprotein (S-layer protein) related protein n=1 Tax=Candidatus Magnetoglobus multicellularis str. Araruama TaxID=890399 RepID=A0A1V1P2F0_9BACT|nr:MAG: cell surface glycoprotein (s-layer protein) related protein [Candidatus Magnetoglobus multicellularis str. Araruama]